MEEDKMEEVSMEEDKGEENNMKEDKVLGNKGGGVNVCVWDVCMCVC